MLRRLFWLSSGVITTLLIAVALFSLYTTTQAAGPAVLIPLDRATVKVDGVCTQGEYKGALVQTFQEIGATGGPFTSTLFIKHDRTNLYICAQARPGAYRDRFFSVYLDPDANGTVGQFTQKDDTSFKTGVITPTHESFRGSGVSNGYVSDVSLDPLWTSAVFASPQEVENVEYEIKLGTMGNCGSSFRVALYHHWLFAVGNDFGWPTGQFYDRPATWQDATLETPLCPPTNTPSPSLTATNAQTVTVTLTATSKLPSVTPTNTTIPTATNTIVGVATATPTRPTATPTKTNTTVPTTTGTPLRGRIAYVYRGNALDRDSFVGLLTSHGYTVVPVPLFNVLITDFSVFDLIIVADDTGDLNTWGFNPAQVTQLTTPNKPIIGLGEGGYAFFGKLSQFIGWPNGWHGPELRVNRAVGAPVAFYSSPNAIPADPVQVYNTAVNAVGIYLGVTPVPSDVFPVALEPGTPDHSSIIMQGCHQLWGFSGNANVMTTNGKNLFINGVEYTLHFQCPTTHEPPTDCATITKESVPASGTEVQPGQVIAYTITVKLSSNPACGNERARIIDYIPTDTIYVPGSASDGIAPQADGSLVWIVTPSAIVQTKTFRVWVSETQCHNQRRVNNIARLLVPGLPPIASNLVTHPVKCPDLTLPNEQPPYAQDEIQVDPYPMMTGKPSKVSVRVHNNLAVAQTVVVSFQLSPDRFGIGLSFSTFATRTLTLPPFGTAQADTTFVPVSSGHYCIGIVIQAPGKEAVRSQRNLDVTEDLRPGVPDTLTFKVGNPTANTTDIALHVINTCPGWTAIVSPTVLANMAPGEVRDAQLIVTPPNPATLGTGCHIDVQGWIGDQLIGGIRKLDVPPVHLPPVSDPWWAEKEIIVFPDPPVIGRANQLCVRLLNPLPTARNVTIDYRVAGEFGYGYGFTSIGTRAVTLPPNSSDLYCITWTPDPGGTDHRCVLVVLSQDGYQDQQSQRNIDLVRLPHLRPDVLSEIHIPIRIHNPDPVTHTLQLSPTLIGINPIWKVKFNLPGGGDPPPNELLPGFDLSLDMNFVLDQQGLQAAGLSAQDDPFFGDEHVVDVAVLLDGQPSGGFTINLADPNTKLLLPITLR